MVRPKILVIDDDKDVIELIRITMEANDYEVYSAENGTEARRGVAHIPRRSIAGEKERGIGWIVYLGFFEPVSFWFGNIQPP